MKNERIQTVAFVELDV